MNDFKNINTWDIICDCSILDNDNLYNTIIIKTFLYQHICAKTIVFQLILQNINNKYTNKLNIKNNIRLKVSNMEP